MARREIEEEDDDERSRYRRSIDYAKDKFGTVRDKTVAARDRTSEFIQERPFTSVAVAAAVGAAVAIGVAALVSGRRRDSFMDRLKDLF